MNLVSVIKRTLFPSEIARLLRLAEVFPRNRLHRFSFGGLNLEVTDFLSVAWQLKEIMVDEELKFQTSSSIPVIYDCGANVGIASIYFKKLYPESVVRSFEPDPGVFGCLERNLTHNGIRGVEVFNKAVWTENGKMEFSSDGADGGSLMGTSAGKMEVECIRLKDLLMKETSVDFLKIDIEGAEVKVIADISPELIKVKYLFVEYHSRVNEKQELDRLLTEISKNGFRYYIHSINTGTRNPLMDPPHTGMDIQLNIHAVRQ